LGLISSNWGGILVELWFLRMVLEECTRPLLLISSNWGGILVELWFLKNAL
jgi:hypothetical protein